MRRPLFTLLIAVVLLVAPMSPTAAVTDGVPDGDGHPYVGFVFGLESEVSCSGWAISPYVFVAAAHCFPGPVEPVVVTFEPDLATAPMESYHFGFWYPHPGYDAATLAFDVAVIQFDDPVDLPRYASLPAEGFVDTLRNHQPVDLVGFGATDFPLGGPHPLEFGTERMQAESKTMNQHHAGADLWLRVMAIPGVGNGEGTGSYMIGDSGSPVLLGGTDIALGVHSWGPNAHAWTAAVRVDTAEVLGFINSFAR